MQAHAIRNVACFLFEIKVRIPPPSPFNIRARIMIEHTFVMLKGIGPYHERRLWELGVTNWDSFLSASSLPGISPIRKRLYDAELVEATTHLQAGASQYFATALQGRDHWRVFKRFQSRALYLDIETTGEPPDTGDVTVVGMFCQGTMTTLVHGEALTGTALLDAFTSCDLVVTFFGTVFDLPFLQAKFPGLKCEKPHFDLCFAARRLGLRGGLKQIEREVGIERPPELHGLDGWDAVHLWNEWRQGKHAALTRLLWYNEFDTRNLEPLAELLYAQLAERYGPPMGLDRVDTPREGEGDGS